jgi:hypothetical protein
MSEIKRVLDKVEGIAYVKNDKDRIRLRQLIQQAENKSVNEQ